MAFTENQKVKIRHVLGYPDVFRGSNLRLESAMDVVGTRPEAQAMVESIIVEIDAAELALKPSNVNAVLTSDGIKQADEVHFFGNSSGTAASNAMRKTGREWVGRLSIALGVPKAHDIFSTAGYSDNSWGSSAAQGSGPIPLG